MRLPEHDVVVPRAKVVVPRAIEARASPAQALAMEATCAAFLLTAVDGYARTRDVALGLVDIESLEPETQVPLERYYGCLEALSEGLAEPLVGVEIAFAMGARGLGALSFMMATAETLGQALADIFDHQALLSPAERYAYTTTSERVRLTYQPHGTPRPAHIIAAQLFLADVVLHTPLMVQGELGDLSVALHAPPAIREAMARRLGVSVVDTKGAAEVSFDAALLARPMRQADPAMHAFFVDYVDTRTPARHPHDVVERLIALVDARLTDGELRAASLARALGVSTRTLQRRLGEAETTLRQLVAARRLRRAKALLMAGRSPVQAALAAGYAEASSLHRALRRQERASTAN